MTERMIQARKDFSRMGHALLALGSITTVLQILLSLLLKSLPPDSPVRQMELMRWILSVGPMYLVAIPVSLLLMRKIPAETCPAENLGGKRFFVLMLICMPLMYGGNLLGIQLSSLLSGGSAENRLLDYIGGNPLYSLLFVVLLAPILEELVFRKQIIDRLGKYGEKHAIFFSALAFGLFHMNLFQFFYAFALGLLFAYVYTRTRRLRYCVIMHMIINFMGSVLAPLLLGLVDMDTLAAMETGTVTTDQLLQMVPGLIAYFCYALVYLGCVIAGFVLLLIRWNKTEFHPASRELLPDSGTVIYGNRGMVLFIVFCLIMTVLTLF